MKQDIEKQRKALEKKNKEAKETKPARRMKTTEEVEKPVRRTKTTTEEIIENMKKAK